MATLEAKLDELEKMAQQMAAYAYQQQNQQGGAQQANPADDIMDADFQEKN